MIARWAGLAAAIGLVGCTGPAQEPRRSSLPSAEVVSGYTFLTPDTKALQDDPFANPGYLWVDRGEALFSSAEGVNEACVSCHEPGALTGAAAHYPAVDEVSGKLVNLEGRINLCRVRHQAASPLSYESDPLLGLTAYVASLSQGTPISVSLTPQTQPHYDAGEAYFFTRRGQFNLACSQCHDDNWGRKLRGDTLSQGHPNGFPAYRLEWQSLGSLHRRFQDCDAGVRAEPLEAGSQVYTDLEFYLAVRAQGLPMEVPAVRR